MGAGLGLNDRSEGTEEVLLLKRVDQLLFVLVRDEISAVGIGADLQHVLNIVVVALADVVPEGGAVCLGSDAGLILRLILGTGLSGKRSRGRCAHHLVDLLLTLQALDVVGEVGDFLLHLVVGCGILRRDHAAVLRVGVKKSLCSLPCLRSLFHEFHNLSHNKNPPLMCEKRKALLKIGYWYHVFICFRLFLRDKPR